MPGAVRNSRLVVHGADHVRDRIVHVHHLAAPGCGLSMKVSTGATVLYNKTESTRTLACAAPLERAAGSSCQDNPLDLSSSPGAVKEYTINTGALDHVGFLHACIHLVDNVLLQGVIVAPNVIARLAQKLMNLVDEFFAVLVRQDQTQHLASVDERTRQAT